MLIVRFAGRRERFDGLYGLLKWTTTVRLSQEKALKSPMLDHCWPILIIVVAASCARPMTEESPNASRAKSGKHALSVQESTTEEDVNQGDADASPERDDTIVLKPDPDAYRPAHTPDRADAADRVVALTNELRKSRNLHTLKIDPVLEKAAVYFAGHMARTNRYGHRADGQDSADRAKEVGYAPCLVDENIAYGFRSNGFSTEQLAEEFFEGWKKSPGHLKNMLDPDVSQTAVTIEEGEGGYFFAVQLFGRPASEMIGFKLTNEADAEFEYTMGSEAFRLLPRQTRTHQACRPQHLEFVWRDPARHEQTVTPRSGDHFIARRDGEGFLVRKK